MDPNEKITVLVVDDSNVIQYALKNFFREYNFEVFTSSDGLEGIEMARVHTPNVIFLDLMMPNLDGIKMLQVIRVLEELKDIPVVVISGNTSRGNVLKAIEAGATTVLSKPLHKEVLKKTLKEVLGDEILSRSKTRSISTKEEEEEIAEQMKKFFLNSFRNKIPALSEYVKKKNRDKVYEIVHQLKGAGTTAGFPEITEYSTKFEALLNASSIDWEQASRYNEIINKKFNEISTK
jgi:two-component system chemotaxis response regulator CheY